MTHNPNEQWCELYEPIRRFVASKVNCPSAVDDIVQNTFLRAYANFDQLVDKDKMMNWLYRIARNCTIDYFRQYASNIFPLAEIERHEEPNQAIDGLDDTSHEVLRCMHDAIKHLSQTYREALLLQLHGRSLPQISEQLGISLSGTKSRIQRGRERIRRKLTGCCHIETDRYGNIIDFAIKRELRERRPLR
ncbi:sigma-70 family RNA polymerase sigma factor [Paenibacillus nanensis]|uniref:Sigma-70 family RNA polymerase sigma factor n=1 Tax=Paenibacillus nanensis TaxID=393251 RepID=A0A3A1UQL9_9BACL|nr:sigma-70 family RNA polymerase sigma factor [Paenibacillus nanensis]RIX50086.1 sigma-70 family RNA polymerase sigma factor [Paenibacillus nanensis]